MLLHKKRHLSQITGSDAEKGGIVMEESPFTPRIIFWMIVNLVWVTVFYYFFGFYMGTAMIIAVLGICALGSCSCQNDPMLDNPITSPLYSDHPNNIFHNKKIDE